MYITFKKICKNILLIVISLGIALICAEIVTRIVHHDKIFSLALVSKQISVTSNSNSVVISDDAVDPTIDINSLLAKIPLAAGVKKNWFYQSPSTLTNRAAQPNADLTWRTAVAPAIGFQIGDVYNLDYVLDQICNNKQHYYAYNDELNALNSIYVFKNKDGSPYPLFHFLKATTFPSGLVTNKFGFRGAEIPFQKPARTIRIAFLGASTTVDQHNYSHAYPEYVGYWLNLWAKSQHLNIKFDVINAGASGYHSEDIAARFVNEVLPLQPDIAIYYEGANQFWPNSFIKFKNPNVALHRPQMILSVSAITRYSSFITDLILAYNKIFFANAKEPAKPAYSVEWPAAVNETNPDLSSSELPFDLKRSINSFNLILKNAQQQKVLFIPTSFVWNVYPGLILHYPHDMYIYSQLNTTFWPFSYAWIHRYSNFQNNVYRKFAQQNHLYFIDIDEYFPRDNNLFVDGIHGTPTGVRMLAWVELQQLIPIIQAQIAAGKLPRPWQNETPPKDYFNNHGNFIITKKEVYDACERMKKNIK
jgi:hypothetical protein